MVGERAVRGSIRQTTDGWRGEEREEQGWGIREEKQSDGADFS